MLGAGLHRAFDRRLDWVFESKSVAVKDITYYIDCRNTASWAKIDSATTARDRGRNRHQRPSRLRRRVAEILPVADQADVAVEGMTRNICKGTHRLTFDIKYTSEGPIVNYKPLKTIIPNPREDEHRRMYMFVTSLQMRFRIRARLRPRWASRAGF